MQNRTLTLGSLFSGSGGFELAGVLAGIKPIFNSEIAPFPTLVTHRRFPDVKHYGDVNKMNGAMLESVDIITFGSPCQDMSIAGKREGLTAARSGLFFQAIRIIKEMREATNGKYPRFCVFENVDGVRTSSGGEDFRIILEEISRIKEPEISIPRPNGKWLKAGEILGHSFSIAWRLLDASGFGVPQRRKRIYLVADFNGQSAGEVLFESESLPWNPPTCFSSWQDTATGAETGIGEAVLYDNHAQACRYRELDVAPTVTATYGMGFSACNNQPLVSYGIGRAGFLGGIKAGFGFSVKEEASPALVASGPGAVAYGMCGLSSYSMLSDNPKTGFYEAETSRSLDTFASNPCCNQGGMVVLSYDVRFTSEGTKNARGHCYETETSRCLDTGGQNPDANHGGIAVIAFEPGAASRVGGHIYTDNKSGTLRANAGDNQQAVALQTQLGMKQQTFALQGSMIGRDDKNGPNGSGVNEDVCFTLNTVDRHCVVAATTGSFMHIENECANTLTARDYKDPQIVNDYTVRRLTPTECARLQGFPDEWAHGLEDNNPSDEELEFWQQVWDEWCNINHKKLKTKNQIRKWLAKPHTDAAEYTMWVTKLLLKS